MGIDSNIAMGVKPVQIENPMNALAQMMQLKDAQQSSQMNAMKMDEDQRRITSQNSLRTMMGGFGSDHGANQTKLLQGGYMKEAGDYGKNQADIQKTSADTQSKQIETAHKRIETMGKAFGFVKDNPSLENASSTIDYLVSNGIMTAEAAAASKMRLQSNPSPENIKAMATQAFQSALEAKDQLPKLDNINAGGYNVATSTNPITGQRTEGARTEITQSADSRASQATQIRGQNMTDSRARAGQAQSASQHAATLAQGSKAPAGYRFTAGGNMEAIPGGPSDLKNSAPAVQKTSDAKDVLSLLDEVDALLPEATGSYLGAGADSLAGMVGYGTKGAQSGAQLKALEGALIAKMPKMSGPQSDKDVLLYKQMAGQVGDATIPVSQRQAASKMIRKLNEKHAGASGIDSLLDKYK